jgi:hypothetical protein
MRLELEALDDLSDGFLHASRPALWGFVIFSHDA